MRRGEFGLDPHVGFVGDVHGDTRSLVATLNRFRSLGVSFVFQLGDFGFFPSLEGFLSEVSSTLERNEQNLLVTLGNHEDYDMLSERLLPARDNWVCLPEYPRILVAPRVHSFTWAGQSFLSVGGANSIDFQYRDEGFSWFSEERISEEDAQYARSFSAEIMLTHECPSGVPLFPGGEDVGPDMQKMYGPYASGYAAQSRRTMREIVDAVKPGLLLHGHYHFYADHITELHNSNGAPYRLSSVGLAETVRTNSAIVMDLRTLRWSFVQ